MCGFFEASSALGPSALPQQLPLLFLLMSSRRPSAAAALLAQLKFDSVILEVITVASAVAFVGRVTLSYKRLNDRWVVVPATLLISSWGALCLMALAFLHLRLRRKMPTAQS